MIAPASPTRSQRAGVDFSITFGLLAVLFFFVVSGILSYWNIRTISNNTRLVSHTHEVILAANNLLSLMKDAETGQRGYVITGDEKYLEPYNAALAHLDGQISDIQQLTEDNGKMQAHIDAIKRPITAKLAELKETIDLRRSSGFEASRAEVVTDRGKNEMEAVRAEIAQMQQEERELRVKRIEEMDNAYNVAISSGLMTGALGVLLSLAVGYLIRRATVIRQRQEWLQGGQVGLANAIFGEQRTELLGENILSFLAKYINIQAGAFFIREPHDFRRVALYGSPIVGGAPERFIIGDGLLGQAAKDEEIIFIDNVPEGYLTIGSALGKGNPRYLVVLPVSTEGAINGVVELGFMQPIDSQVLELLKRLAEAIAVAVKSASYRAHLENLLEETQRQSEELQTQSEELRVSNEELEEQSRALKESQARLEQQHSELEQTNSQLEEQTQLLETQKEDLERAKAGVQQKAQELEQASRYKSDFLANMSHELRTPLNSSLILAKLLADNSEGNLTAEQVKYADTIRSSGNDLLSLINDILDLSKIEAGHMDVRPETVHLSRMTKDLERMFDPIAKQKGLSFEARIDGGCPQSLETDRQRLEQVLKNLLSNAFKFTEHGNVALEINCAPQSGITFSVTDTGIGIAEAQQQNIFEAFRQADGTISRKFGGTGLGLSISRELTRLLGGKIDLKSKLGKGSIFSITLPERYDITLVKPRYQPPVAYDRESPPDSAPDSVWPVQQIQDDRDNLTGKKRVLLVVEDDKPFAHILYDLAHELDFECIIATSAEEALNVARQYLPSAVILDVGLPDNSGLSVLDRLKRNSRTRHIPVHVVSANDYAQKAFSLGAVGHMLKPVQRDELAEALKKLEFKLEQNVRRILIVEDDPVQRDSVVRLLGGHDVEIDAVGTAAECLQRLKEKTYDCMVLDLSLPDASGHSLLETLSQESAYSFPPVIVYTARDISSSDEQKLRRYSKSIIIKGAKSPERLLDEVTLFLHQVVSELPVEQQRMLEQAKSRDAVLEDRHILVVEDDVRNVYALTSILEPRGVFVHIARNGREALDVLKQTRDDKGKVIDLVLMDVMMPEMDGLTATQEIRKDPAWKKLPIIMLTAKAMKNDQERCLEVGANDYMAKPLDVEKLLSLVRVWMPR